MSVKLFGIAKDIVGTSTLKIAYQISTVDDLLVYLKSEYPEFVKLTSLLVAVNDEYALAETAISDADEVAIIPPVSGG
ncbi:MAG: molybdopterin converting factor subunit 1 [Bacteroidetes bacterium]|nr:MAG: molybdopterin converting factor subunit 1 [Bacteroidota bacterium]